MEDCNIFPRINSTNQQLIGEPSLKAGKAWFGPIQVPRNRLGYTEIMKRTNAGPYYEIKMEALHIGDSPQSRVNLENMPYHRYLVVGKVRAGGHYHLVGTPDSPCTFNPAYQSGNGAGETAQTLIQFLTEHISKAYILPSFTADTLSPGVISPGDEEDPLCMVNQKEIISFNEQATINIPWTPTRAAKFGSFPVIDVYIEEDGSPPTRTMAGSIEADQEPPAFTELSVKLGGNPSGFIVIT